MKWNLLYQITAASRTPEYGATAPRSAFSLSSVFNWIRWNPPPNKIPGYATAVDWNNLNKWYHLSVRLPHAGYWPLWFTSDLSLISTPRHKTTHCTAEARFAVPFSNLYPLPHLSNTKYSRRPTEMQTVKEGSPHMSAIPTAVHAAGNAAVCCSNFAAFLVAPYSKYSVDQHRLVSAHI